MQNQNPSSPSKINKLDEKTYVNFKDLDKKGKRYLI